MQDDGECHLSLSWLLATFLTAIWCPDLTSTDMTLYIYIMSKHRNIYMFNSGSSKVRVRGVQILLIYIWESLSRYLFTVSHSRSWYHVSSLGPYEEADQGTLVLGQLSSHHQCLTLMGDLSLHSLCLNPQIRQDTEKKESSLHFWFTREF